MTTEKQKLHQRMDELQKADLEKIDLFAYADMEKLRDHTSEPVREFRRWSGVVSVNSQSLRFHRVATYHPKKNHIAKRGAITSFSRHSRLRLRDSLASCCLASSAVYGVTLTLPWSASRVSLDVAIKKYKVVFNRFCVSLRRAFPNSASIFRHELQRRKMPHCHIVLFLAYADSPSFDVLATLRRDICGLWLRALGGEMLGGSVSSFLRYGVKVDYLSNRDAMYRYISDHASKSKQAQLGYKGRQWGFINKRLFSNRVSLRYQFRHQSDLVFFQRHIYRASRFFVSSRCVFGRKLTAVRQGVSIQFVKGSTVRRLVRFINSSGVKVLRCGNSIIEGGGDSLATVARPSVDNTE